MTDRTTILSSNPHTRLGRSGLAKAALILLGVLVAGPVAAVQASTAMLTPAFTMTSVTPESDTNHYSIGYIFTTTTTLRISAFGVLDHNGNTLTATDVPINLYYSFSNPNTLGSVGGGHNARDLVTSDAVNKTDTIFSLSGGTYTSGDGFRYRDLPSGPLTLLAGTYELVYSTLGVNFGYSQDAVGLAMAPGVSTPLGFAVYNNSTGDDTAGYAVQVSSGAFPGFFGPNFEIIPEPASAGLLLAGSLMLLKRRRRA